MTKPIALVTGAAQGIGLACAKVLLRDGLRVVLADLQENAVRREADLLGEDALGSGCDTTDPRQVEALLARVEAHFGPVSVLVNNAGIAPATDFLSTEPDDFRRVLEVNVTGTFIVLQQVARRMVDHGISGSIINISSIAAQVAVGTMAAYCASKGGVMQLTKAAALALAPHNIRVNAVGPGSVGTQMLSKVHTSPQVRAAILSRTPLNRLGTPEDIADTVAFLASDRARYITAETIYVDGGRLGLNLTC